MRIKNEEVVDRFLETHNMDFFYCILADKEAERLAMLPDSVTKTFSEKITTMALKHTALNDIPDYIVEEYEVAVKEPLPDFRDEEDDEDSDDDYFSDANYSQDIVSEEDLKDSEDDSYETDDDD